MNSFFPQEFPPIFLFYLYPFCFFFFIFFFLFSEPPFSLPLYLEESLCNANARKSPPKRKRNEKKRKEKKKKKRASPIRLRSEVNAGGARMCLSYSTLVSTHSAFHLPLPTDVLYREIEKKSK